MTGCTQGAPRQVKQLMIADRLPSLRIEGLPNGVALLEKTSGIQLPFAIAAQVTEPRMSSVLALTREINRGDALGFSGNAREIGLVRANTAGQFDVAQAVGSVGPHEDTAFRAVSVVTDHIEHAVEFVRPRADIFRRPLEFLARHGRIDEKFQLCRGETTQVVFELSRLVGAVEIIELPGHILRGPGHTARRHLLVRPERRLALVVDQSESQHERAVGGPRRRMRTAQLLQPRQNHGREVVRLQLAEKLLEEFVIRRQRGKKVFRGASRHWSLLRCVVIGKQGLQDFRRNTRSLQLLRRRGQGTPRRIAGQRCPGRNDEQGIVFLRIAQHAASEPSAQRLRFGRAEQTAPLVEALPLTE